MNKPKKIKELEFLATRIVGDGKAPNLFFVTDQGNVVTTTRNFHIAYEHWRQLASRLPKVECALEDRRFGCIASIEPKDDGSKVLVKIDDSSLFHKFYPQNNS